MRRLLAFFLSMLLALSVGLGSVAHADEGAGGVALSAATAAATGHHDGDADQVPADADKGYPHHHGTCHGEHVGVPATAGAVLRHGIVRSSALFPSELPRAGLVSHPALRPPRA